MRRLGERQHGFGTAILDASLPVPEGLVDPDGDPSPRRFAVYRNNVVVGMVETLAAAYPVVRRLVGEEFFDAMAAHYARSEPPASPMLFDYGKGFPAFLSRFEPLADLPYVVDVARIERAWVEAYNAAEASPLSSDEMARIDLGRIGAVCMSVHPSLRIVRSRFPALTIWASNVDGATPVPVDLDAGGEDTLVLRIEAEVELRQLPPGGAGFLSALMRGASIAAAAEESFLADAEFDLDRTLAGLIDADAFTGWSYHLANKHNDGH